VEAVAPVGLGVAIVSVAMAVRRLRRGELVRLVVEPYRNDRASGEALGVVFAATHSLLGTRRSMALEVHLDRRAGGALLAWFAVLCPRGLERPLEAALRAGYPNVRVRALRGDVPEPPAALRLRRRVPPRVDDEPVAEVGTIERLLAALAAAGPPATVRIALRPASRLVEHLCSSSEGRIGPLWWADPVVLGRDRAAARTIASALAAGTPRLLARRARASRLSRSPRCLYRPAELAGLWCLPAPEFAALPCLRRAVPLAPAPPGISRAGHGAGLLRDEHGAVTIAPPLRRQHVAVVGAVDQGKTSFLVASAREDLRREDCALIVLDPKGDAAEAVLSIVPRSRTVTLLDMAAPRAGFNPLRADAPPDAIADQVVAALRGLFSEGEVRGSSDRYLRNAVIAALACGGGATLWDAARLLEVGEEGRAFRAHVAERLIELPSYAELARFFAYELPAQLADARATTTAKLDAPANKLARVLNSPAVKRVLLNESLRIDFDRLIERGEVLIVRGALGEIGAGNVAVLMQLLLGMLDAALSRVQDRRSGASRRAVALKVDEAPLAINAAFAQTLALKRSAGLETVACWQTDAQWDDELRAQLDALFAHRVLFATASADDARSAAALLMSDFSDQIRAGDEQLATLASPDVRLHLPRHTALASWTTVGGRERPFLATTMPLTLDRARIDWHARAQEERGGCELREPAPPVSTLLGHRGPTALQSPREEAQSPPTAVGRPTESMQPPRPAGEPLAALTPPLVAADRRPAGALQPPQAAAGRSAATPQSTPTAPVGESFGRSAARSGCEPAPPAVAPPVPAPASYGELLALDGARRLRLLAPPRAASSSRLTPADRDLLAWLAGARCAMTTQIHRRFNPRRSMTVTQRHLKRLADRGLIARFQLHREDGGGVPLCCAVSGRAIELLGIGAREAPELSERALAGLRGDVHLTGWLLALEQLAGAAIVEILGPGRAAIVPGVREPAALELEGGLRARDFLLTAAGGERGAVERFAAVRPGAVVSLRSSAGASRDLVVVADPGALAAPALLEAYDHLISGWWRSVERYRRIGGPPAVVVVCADRAEALARAGAADALLTACLAAIGVSPREWLRPGRQGIHFAAEEDVHRGSLGAWRVPALPPELRPAGDEDEPSPTGFAQSPPVVTGGSVQPPWL
jgi:hypothetical protein